MAAYPGYTVQRLRCFLADQLWFMIRIREGEDCQKDKREDYQNCYMLYCVCTTTVHSNNHTHTHTHIWAVLTRDCSFRFWFNFCVFFCIFVLTRTSLFVLVLAFAYFIFFGEYCFWLCKFDCQCQCSQLPEKTCLQNDRFCVKLDVKACWLTCSWTTWCK